MKNSDAGFLDEIKISHLHIDSPKIEIGVARTFGDIDLQSWLFDI